MSAKSAIEWTGSTWNPVTGCTKVSPGCAYCYIDRTPPFRMAGRKFERWSDDYGETWMRTDVRLHPERLEQPFRWRKPRRIFVNSLSDLFHEDIPDEYIDRVFAVMQLARRHVFQVLTKRPERMREFITHRVRVPIMTGRFGVDEGCGRNIWLGVTAENQHWADQRIPILLDTPAAVRFVSCEPLLGALDLTGDHWGIDDDPLGIQREANGYFAPRVRALAPDAISWVIAGGESGGPEYRALVERWPYPDDGHEWVPKPSALEAVRSLRDQCVAAGVPFFFKQWGGKTPKSGGRLLDGREWSEYPA